MGIKIYNNHVEGCVTGISAPADANMDIGANRFIACGKAIDINTPGTLIGVLGLSPDTPPEVLREVLAYVGAGQRSEPEIAEKVETAGLFKWLAAGADATTLVTTLGSLFPYLPKILATFGG
ncbi:hypothetical protein O4D10_09180 [Xanthomonas citri pv. citri]|uniref:hypothetical protein n=1 Tax=Xanthomonas citri TaxID=346 RepID=UPI0036DC34E2